MVEKLWNKLFSRPSVPSPGTSPPPMGPNTLSIAASNQEYHPIEDVTDVDWIEGTPLELGETHTAGRDESGQLIRRHARKYITLGCGHQVKQIQAVKEKAKNIRGVAGTCFYCQQEIFELIDQQIRSGHTPLSPFDAARLIRVCTDCARMSVSGKLCCPRHSMIVPDGNGGQICLGWEEMQAEQIKARRQMIFGPLLSLFVEEVDPNEHELPPDC